MCTLSTFSQSNQELLSHYKKYYKQMQSQADIQGVINALTHLNVLEPSQARKDTLATLYMNEGRHVEALSSRRGRASGEIIYLNSNDENIIDEIRYELTNILLAEDINCKIDGRIKSPYSIWNKIKKKNISFEQLSDIMAFRIITNSTRECYKCLGIIHRNYQYIPGRFKDFISSPKSNGYRALHTTLAKQDLCEARKRLTIIVIFLILIYCH